MRILFYSCWEGTGPELVCPSIGDIRCTSRPPAEAGSIWWSASSRRSPSAAWVVEVIQRNRDPKPFVSQRMRISSSGTSTDFLKESLSQDTS